MVRASPATRRSRASPSSRSSSSATAVALLGDQPVDPPADRCVQGVAGVEQAQVGGADGRAQRVGDAGGGDAAQHADVAQAAGGLLEVALEQEGQLAVGLPSGPSVTSRSAGSCRTAVRRHWSAAAADQRVGQRRRRRRRAGRRAARGRP